VSTDGADNDKEDYTTAAELTALLDQHTIMKDQVEYVNMNLGLSVEDFYKSYIEDNAEFSMDKFYEERGEQKIVTKLWSDATGDDATYDKMSIQKVRTMEVNFQVKGNPFVKEAPTVKNYKIVEYSPTKLHMRVLNRTHEVPYCDSFGVEEDWFVASPAGQNVKSSVIRITTGAVWYKSTMMKSMILSNVKKESQANWDAWKENITNRDHKFVQKKKKAAAKGKRRVGYESSNKIAQRKKDKEE
jgi:hypothetical protein